MRTSALPASRRPMNLAIWDADIASWRTQTRKP
jgi:hypothetical protein